MSAVALVVGVLLLALVIGGGLVAMARITGWADALMDVALGLGFTAAIGAGLWFVCYGLTGEWPS